MDTGCLEIVVKSRPDAVTKVYAALAALLGICLAAAAFLLAAGRGFLFTVICLAGTAVCMYGFTVFLARCRVEYEYDYLDRELRIAAIYNRTSRRELGVYDLTQMEILAPEHSHRLDSVRPRLRNLLDYSARVPVEKGIRWMLVMEKGTGILLDLDPSSETAGQVLGLIRSFAPRKVYSD